MATHFTRRSALTIIAGGGALLSAGRASAEAKSGRAIYPVAVPIYQSQFVADRAGFFKEAGLDCKLDPGRQRRQDARDHRFIAGRYRHRRCYPSDAAQQSRARRVGF